MFTKRQDDLVDVTSLLTDLAVRYGYAGVFATTALGSLVPFLPFPNFLVVILLSNILDPVEIGVLAGIGGSLGKITSYLLGRSGYGLSKARTRGNLDIFRNFVWKYGGLGIFILALIPIRDEVYAIPMGMVKFPFWRFLLANAVGKVLLYTAVAYLGRFYLATVSVFLGEGEVIATILALVFTITITVLLQNLDWRLTLDLYRKGGVLAVVSSLPYLFGNGKRKKEE